MDILWAPWRMEYITPQIPAPAQDTDCFICQGVVDCEHDSALHILSRTSETITLLNKFPYNNGHLLVAPRRHIAQLDLLTAQERAALTEEVNRWMSVLRRAMNPDGFNVGLNEGLVAGAGLPGHLHWHIVPRWNGDTNFMTSIASSKVMPQSLDALWEILCKKS